jgi:hypothetical protein
MTDTQTQTPVTSTGTSGSTCSTTGPYKCNTHPTVVVFFKQGDRFSNCPSSASSSGHSTTWTVVSSQ